MNDKKKKPQKLRARLPRGFVDRSAADIRAVDEMTAKIREVYERYGFDPVETPLFEYTDALGKFLPDSDRPNEGVFSLQDDDDQWMSARYDLTAPLARHVAENFNDIQLPYRTYRAGYVFRNEKPGPGRFRQFMQFDADTVGAAGVQADAEMCMMMADTMEALGIARGDYVIRVNNRKVLDGVLEANGIAEDSQKLSVLRAIDTLDKFGVEGVRQRLGKGRWDSGQEGEGDFTPGAGLDAQKSEQVTGILKDIDFSTLLDEILENVGVEVSKRSDLLPQLEAFVKGAVSRKILDVSEDVESVSKSVGLSVDQINGILLYLTAPRRAYETLDAYEIPEPEYRMAYDHQIAQLEKFVGDSKVGAEGISELRTLAAIFRRAGYRDRIEISPQTVRGLEYYTGPVFEAELTFPVTNEKGQKVVFGSVGGGGRYDGLVSRFMGQPVPATGFSIGVSRLMTALKNLGKLGMEEVIAPVVVCVMDRDLESLGKYQQFTQALRHAGIRAEMYQGNKKNFGDQLKYADRRGSPLAIIQGGDERAQSVVQIKDLIEGKRLSGEIEDNTTWREARVAQVSVPEADLVAKVREMLAEQAEDRARAAQD